MQTFYFGLHSWDVFLYLCYMRIWFFGTPSLSARVLQDIINAPDMEVCFAVTNADVAIGRSRELRATPVKILAEKYNIPVFCPEKIRWNTDFFDTIDAYGCDYFVVVAYGRILPREVLEIPKKLCINIHGSILPSYRGASPIQSVLLDGVSQTGVTIMKMSEWMDEGDILKIRNIHIDSDETTDTLFEKFSVESGPTLIQTLREYQMWGITPLPQDASIATYCKKIQKEDGLLDWNLPAKTLYNKWQWYTPWPGIFTLYDEKRLLLEKVHYSEDIHDHEPGMVIKWVNGDIQVACKMGYLNLEQVKLEWKKSQTIRDFINVNQKFISSKL